MTIPAMPASMLSNSDPREGSRDTGEGIIVSESPDVCLTPMGGGMVPIPYQIWARQQDVAEMADTVRQTDMRTHVRGSLVLRCYGDEPGTGGGVISGTTGAECTPKTWSNTVPAQGRNVVRHDDEWWMNHRNTYGRLYYTKDVSEAPITQPCAVTPLLRTVASTSTDVPSATPLAAAPPTSNLPAISGAGVPVSGVSGSGGIPGLDPGDRVQQLHPPVDGTNVNQPLEDLQEKERGRPLRDIRRAITDGAAMGGGGRNGNGVRTSGGGYVRCWDITKFLRKRSEKSRQWLINEYCRQIKSQQDAINDLTVSQYQRGRGSFEFFGRSDDQAEFRESALEDLTKEYSRQGYSAEEAERKANDLLSGQVGLHDPDQVIGGSNSVVNQFGSAEVNSSIGGGWPSRKDQVDDWAKSQNSNDKMDVHLCVQAGGEILCQY